MSVRNKGFYFVDFLVLVDITSGDGAEIQILRALSLQQHFDKIACVCVQCRERERERDKRVERAECE